jgi:hypothetical protein
MPMRQLFSILFLIALAGGLRPAAAQDTSCAPPLELAPGARIHTRPGINIRNLPSRSGGVVEYLDSSITFRITQGPVCADGVNWWRVSGPTNFNPGWIAERESRDGRYLIFPADPDPATLCAPPIDLTIGQSVPVVSGGIRVRAAPTLAGQVLTVVLADTRVTVVGGPVCADGYNWWEVTAPINPASDLLVRGWLAEGFGGAIPWLAQPPGPSLEAGNLCPPPLRGLGVGTRAYVSYRTGDLPRNLRAEPGRDAPVLYTLIDGIAFTIIGGPVCADNINWWQIQITTRPDAVGWLAEGGPGNYWIRRFRLNVRY